MNTLVYLGVSVSFGVSVRGATSMQPTYTSNDLDEMKGVQYSIFACLVISFVRFAYVL